MLLNRAPISTQLHPPPSSLFQPPPNSLNVIRTKILHVIGQFPKYRPKNPKLSILTENWHTWCLGDADSESGLRFLKFQPQNPFLGKFRPKKSKLSVCLKIGTHGISRMLIFIQALVFKISKPKSIFGQILAEKVKVVHFGWKLAHRVSWRCWFLFWH